MSDSQMPEGVPAEESVTDAGPVTAGRLLREARERMHVDVAVLASMLKVPEHKLRALEADQLDQLPDLTFARALAASVCRTLQIEPAPVLALLPQGTKAGALPGRGHAPINAPYRTQSESTVAARTGSVLQSRYIWLVFTILLAAVVLALLPSLDRLSLPDAGQDTRAVAAQPAASVAAAPATDIASAPVEVASAAAAPAAAGSAAVAAQAPASAASAVVTSGDDLHLTAAQDSWVQVRDASGKTLLSRTIKAGETLGLTGQAPYRVVVGNIQGLTLQVRGQPFDFSTVTKTTTARFEVQ
ncbi:hypothetical protein CCO03_13590 [Comamonas serinivorans]|uniref:Cytoskeleton protein RodZ-like C-terminal domain-containing protein n=1 Tax=Comamonas serinivorans TaxID=1082851 RepID=A0A1Y0EQJ4_9BURK|nr:helix-turn-helix domain-containing protein [Comamonas serinivorans]ARU05579.1 hypothetical protein CCO03_13590 [Comamonas serinivorans]